MKHVNQCIRVLSFLKERKYLPLVLFAFLFFSTTVLARGRGVPDKNRGYPSLDEQQNNQRNGLKRVKISGVIIDEDDSPIVGASVVQKGTANGTVTTENGRFSIIVPSGTTLQVTFIGYKKKELHVTANSKIGTVRLEKNTSELGEVFVIGYGVQKKKLATGANLQVNGENLEKRNTTSALQALQGQSPGVQITSSSGQPGDGFKVLVRGAGTTGNSAPLYVVDGVETDDISYLNNSDIASVDVLKDAASAAIYGSQAANGVVLITTKSGAEGKSQINFDAYYGVQNAAKKVKMLDASQYAMIMNESNVNSGNQPYFTPSQIRNLPVNTNWMNEMFAKNVPTQNYILSASGGSAKSLYSISLGYTSQGGIVGGPDYSDYKRYSFHVNTEQKMYHDIIKVGEHLNFAYIQKRGVATGGMYNNSLRKAFNTSPLLPMRDDNGDFVDPNYKDDNLPVPIVNGVPWTGQPWAPWNMNEANPYAMMANLDQNRNNSQKLIGDVYLQIEPLKHLVFKTTFGLNYSAIEDRSFTPSYTLSQTAIQSYDYVYQSMSRGHAWNWDNTLSYAFDFAKNNHMDVMIGSSARQYSGSWMNAQNSDLIVKDIRYAWLSNATNSNMSHVSLKGGPDVIQSRMSYFGRVSYNWKERYLLNATFRADGSSKFYKTNRWGYFPSVSGGWVMTEEPWLKNKAKWLEYLKLRGSWGQVGNQNIGDLQYISLMNSVNSQYVFGNNSGASFNVPGTSPSVIGNKNLKWETSEQLDFGFDATFFKGKLSANFDWYRKSTKDWLINIPVLASTGTQTMLINGGNVVNSGLELGLNYTDKIGRDFHYSISGNVTYNKNRVGHIPTEDGIIHGQTNLLYEGSSEFFRAEDGQPIGYFRGWKTNGVFQSEDEVKNYVDSKGKIIQPKAKPGDVRYVDVNHDGVINDFDKVKVGDPNPDMTFGFNIACDYKNFDFALSANGVAGNQIVQSYREKIAKSNYPVSILDRWHGPGTSTRMPRVTNDNLNWDFSDLYIHDGSFLRINTITLGYDFAKLLKSKYIGQLRLYASVQNPFTFTKYDGADPEVGYGFDSFSSGVDLGYYPNPRNFLLGLNVKF